MGQAYEYKIPQTLSALPGSQKLSSWTFPVESTGEDLPAWILMPWLHLDLHLTMWFKNNLPPLAHLSFHINQKL